MTLETEARCAERGTKWSFSADNSSAPVRSLAIDIFRSTARERYTIVGAIRVLSDNLLELFGSKGSPPDLDQNLELDSNKFREVVVRARGL